jgi:hypothetical protein
VRLAVAPVGSIGGTYEHLGTDILASMRIEQVPPKA